MCSLYKAFRLKDEDVSSLAHGDDGESMVLVSVESYKAEAASTQTHPACSRAPEAKHSPQK